MSQYKVKVPELYAPSVTITFFKPRECWRYKCLLPSTEKVVYMGYISKKIVKTEKQAQKFRDFKHDELKKGILNEKEYKKLSQSNLNENYTLQEAITKYIELTKLAKTPKTIQVEQETFSVIFSYFSKEFEITHLSQIKEKHIQNFKESLLLKASERKKQTSRLKPLLKSAGTKAEKQLITKMIRDSGISPATAKSYFQTLKKLFNKLFKEKKIFFNPAAGVTNIQISTSDAVRKNTFEPSDIIKLANCDYVHQEGLPLTLFVLFLAETGARKGEGLHFEWDDFDSKTKIWHIKEKPHCPTKYRIGWKPKWGKERKIYLSESAIRILDLIEKVESVGHVRIGTNGKNTNGTTRYTTKAVPANFVFTVKDEVTKLHRRVDNIRKSWHSLLEKAEVGEVGLDQFVLHDFRRYKNVINECVYNMSLKQRSAELGNSERINTTHYSGEASNELLKFQSQIQELTARNLELEAKLNALSSQAS